MPKSRIFFLTPSYCDLVLPHSKGAIKQKGPRASMPRSCPHWVSILPHDPAVCLTACEPVLSNDVLGFPSAGVGSPYQSDVEMSDLGSAYAKMETVPNFQGSSQSGFTVQILPSLPGHLPLWPSQVPLSPRGT